MIPSLNQYFRCSDSLADFAVEGELSKNPGYFRFGSDTVCYGRLSVGLRSDVPGPVLYDVSAQVHPNGCSVFLPFDPGEVIDNLRKERYATKHNPNQSHSLIRDAYYRIRPVLPLAVRRHLQRIYLRDWNKLPFPAWPVGRTVDSLMRQLLLLGVKSKKLDRIPFIWFWPDGADACAIMTHDVETERGRQFCYEMMNLDDSYGVPASFQIVPEKRYVVERQFLNDIKRRGFEVNVQDLNHDGKLFQDKAEFERRVKEINRYGREYEAAGFRSAVLYRDQAWYDLLEFEYDMSVPNVAHLDPQRGGCCTVMPYFVGGLLELPVTTTQDHSLFNVLNNFTTNLWKQQTDSILQQHGLMSFIIHPDYIIARRAQETYKSLLAMLARLQSESNVWLALPKDVNRWWRQRDKMVLTCNEGKWSIEGPGSERARIAFAIVDNDRLVFSLAGEPSARLIQAR